LSDGDNVIQAEFGTKGRWLQGPCICLACRHEWQGVAPVGAIDLVCPGCGCPRGVYKTPLVPGAEQLTFVCDCGCYAFYVFPENQIMCMGCGHHGPLP